MSQRYKAPERPLVLDLQFESFLSANDLEPLAFVGVDLTQNFSRWFDELVDVLKFTHSTSAIWRTANYLKISGAIEVEPEEGIGLPTLTCIPSRGSKGEEGFVCCCSRHVEDLSRVAIEWLEVLRKTLLRMHLDAPCQFWTALIGPDSNADPWENKCQATLAGVVQIGTSVLVPSNDYLEESRPHQLFPRLDTSVHTASWPVFVTGTTQAHNQTAALQSVATDLSILTAIMTLLFETSWKVREMPSLSEHTLPELPERNGDHVYAAGDPYLEQRYPIELPNWIDTAWERATRDPIINAALFTYQEALRLASEHPSYSLVALMSCLQTIGSLHETRQNKCVRAGLLQSVDSADADRLIQLYSQRSKIAHQGLLFGSEKISGALPLNFTSLSLNPGFIFEMVILREVRSVARQSLIVQFESDVK